MSLKKLPEICREISDRLKPVREMGIGVAFQPGFPRNWGTEAGNGIARILFLSQVSLAQTGVGRLAGWDETTLLLHFAISRSFFGEDGPLVAIATAQELLEDFTPKWCKPIKLGELKQTQPEGDYWTFEQRVILQVFHAAPATEQEPLLVDTKLTQSIQ